MTTQVAILTGDLIGSTAASPQAIDATMALIRVCAGQIDPRNDFTRFRGDGWQLRLTQPGDCAWACLLILSRLKADETALGCRIAVGIGAETETRGRDLSTAIGPAFTASGHALDRMPPGQTLALEGEGVDRFRQLAFAAAALSASRWSQSQAEALALKLDPATPAEDRLSNEMISRQLGISRQAVDARLKAADYPLLDDIMSAFLAAYGAKGTTHG